MAEFGQMGWSNAYHLFATKYRLLLPSEEELRAELVREQRLLEEAAPADARGRGKARG
jgi:hypothetical protein